MAGKIDIDVCVWRKEGRNSQGGREGIRKQARREGDRQRVDIRAGRPM